MNKHISLLIVITTSCLVLTACGLQLDHDVDLGPDTLARIDKVNETLNSGIKIEPETRRTINEINKTIRQGVKAGFDEPTLQRVDELLRVVEDGLKIGLDEETLNEVDRLINVIDDAPEEWQVTGQEIIQELERAAGTTSKQMADDVQDVIDRTLVDSRILVSTVGVEFRCNVDFLNARAGETVDRFIGRTIVGRLRDILSGKRAAEIPPTPWVCQVLPEKIELVKKGDQFNAKESIITITGFNLQNLTPTIEVLDESNAKVEAIRLPLLVGTSSYQIQLNLQGIDFRAAPVRSKISFHWPNVPDPSEIALLLPEEKPIAKFEVDPPTGVLQVNPRTGTLELMVVFVDQSTGAESWDWNFGDGETSHDPQPTHIYRSSGTKRVQLTVSNSLGETDTASKNVYIEDPLQADISADTSTGTAPLTVSFEGIASGVSGNNQITWHWDFGDLTQPSTEKDPSHTFANEGVYSVTLTITEKQRKAQAFTSITVTAPPQEAIPEIYRPDAFFVKTFSFYGSNDYSSTTSYYKTDLSVNEFDHCGVFGFSAEESDLRRSLIRMNYHSLMIVTEKNPREEYWVIKAQPAVHWTVDILCTRKDSSSSGTVLSINVNTLDDTTMASSDEYVCSVAGFQFTNPDSEEKGDSVFTNDYVDGTNKNELIGPNLIMQTANDDQREPILTVLPYTEEGVWKVRANMGLSEIPYWEVNLLCFPKDPDRIIEQRPIRVEGFMSDKQTVIRDPFDVRHSRICGVAGFALDLRGLPELYRSEAYNNTTDMYETTAIKPVYCKDLVGSISFNGCPILSVGMDRNDTVTRANRGWYPKFAVAWGQIVKEPKWVEVKPDNCGGWFGPACVTTYQNYWTWKWYFSKISWSVKPLCLVNLSVPQLEPVQPVVPNDLSPTPFPSSP